MDKPEVISMGNMLVEIMRSCIDQPFDQPGEFIGPFPSGDTPIYIDTVARLGHQAGFIGDVGNDGFGRCLLDRFARDGVESSQVKILDGHTTGVAFVAYYSGGSRRFIYHWKHAAAGQLGPEQVEPAYFESCKWLHLTGCNLAVNESCRNACYRALNLVPREAIVSFDPNIRPEVLGIDEIRNLCDPVLKRANVFLPSIGEARMFSGHATDEDGCRYFAENGMLVVMKLGVNGCRIYSKDEVIDVPGFQVTEVDPTGAGDSFCAGFTVAMLEQMSLSEAGRFANAVGALAVTRQGPMEGAPDRASVSALLQTS